MENLNSYFNFVKKCDMKTYTYLLLLVILPIFAFTQENLHYPIDIVYHSATENYYVSNWADGDGYILKLDKDGDIIETFYNGLSYAGGLRIVGDILYVLDNQDLNISGSSLPSFLVGIELSSGNPILNKKISQGGTYLDFMDFAYGNLYITDDQQSKVYKYNIQNNMVSDFLTDLDSPVFGICFDDYNDRLLFTQNGIGESYLFSIPPLGGSDATKVFTTDAYMKGLVRHPNADFYFSTWDVNSSQWGDEEVGKVNNNFTWEFLPSYPHNRPFGLCVGYNDQIVVCNWGDHTLSFLEDEVFSVEEHVSKSDPYTVYPNPNNGKFNIGFSDNIASNIEVVILNMTGQQVFHEKVNNSSLLTDREFDMQHLPAGTYVVILKDDRTVSQKKLIIN